MEPSHSASASQGGVALGDVPAPFVEPQQQRAERRVVRAVETDRSNVIARPLSNDQPLCRVVEWPAQTAVGIRYRLRQSEHLIAEHPPCRRGCDIKDQVGQGERSVHGSMLYN